MNFLNQSAMNNRQYMMIYNSLKLQHLDEVRRIINHDRMKRSEKIKFIEYSFNNTIKLLFLKLRNTKFENLIKQKENQFSLNNNNNININNNLNNNIMNFNMNNNMNLNNNINNNININNNMNNNMINNNNMNNNINNIFNNNNINNNIFNNNNSNNNLMNNNNIIESKKRRLYFILKIDNKNKLTIIANYFKNLSTVSNLMCTEQLLNNNAIYWLLVGFKSKTLLHNNLIFNTLFNFTGFHYSDYEHFILSKGRKINLNEL